MANRKCWDCGDRAVMTPRGMFTYEDDTDFGEVLIAPTLYECPGCHAPSIGITALEPGSHISLDAVSRQEQYAWLPDRGSAPKFADVPTHIASAASEAFRCRSVGANRAAGALARAVVEATAKHVGHGKGNLQDKIDAMAKAGLLREHIKEAAHEVRYFGNDMAHGDFVDEVDATEADEVLELMSLVLEEVFQAPARVDRVRAAREARKTAGA